MAAVVFWTFAFLVCTAQSQICGPGSIYPGPCGPCATEICGPCSADPYGTIPFLPNFVSSAPPACAAPIPCGQPCLHNIAPNFIQNQIPSYPNLINQCPCSQPLFPNAQLPPSVVTNPVPQCASTTPVVATTIVDNTLANSLANAIQLLIVSNLIENTLGSSSGSGNSLGVLDSPCGNNFDVKSPDFYHSPQVVTCEYPVIDGCTYVNNIPYFQDTISSTCPCVDVSPCPNFATGLGNCNCLGFDNSGPNTIFGVDPCSNSFNFGSAVPSFGCVEPVLATIAPMAVEVPFPASIPAQLTCNFGYIPTHVPCVSVNVEPLPFDGCSNLFGNLGNGLFY